MKPFMILVCFPFLFFRCSTDEYRYVGKLKVKGIEDIYVKIYQKDKWDWATPLHYELVKSKDTIIQRRRFLVGTLDGPLENVEGFYSGSCDGIIYVAYVKPDRVYAMYNFKTRKEYTYLDFESGLQVLRTCNPELYMP
jgi:hypothetical protein